jgi:LmbE family N-acetylglucosaminyl deacetylase
MAAMRSRAIQGSGTTESEWAQSTEWSALPKVNADQIVSTDQRCVVIAPHPDDEILPCGGLLSHLAERSGRVLIVSVTDGEKSHRAGSKWTTDKLRQVRSRETAEALTCIGNAGAEALRLAFPDGGVRMSAVTRALGTVLKSDDVVLTPWRLDGHPDHEQTTVAILQLRQTTGFRLFEMPIWGWHWSAPNDPQFPWKRCVRLFLSTKALERKRHAIQQFKSQLEVDLDTGMPAVLPRHVLERFWRPWEIFFINENPA